MAKATPEQIGAAFRRRRLSLQLNQDQLPGVSSATVRKVETGKEPNPSERVRVAMAQALGWQDDAYDVLRVGGVPTPSNQTIDLPLIDGRSDGDRLTAVEQRLDRIEEAVQRLLEGEGAP